MIKGKNGVDKNEAFKLSCENNNIVLSRPGSNKRPVSYIDLTGEKKMLNSKATNLIDTDNVAKDLLKSHYRRKGVHTSNDRLVMKRFKSIAAGQGSCVVGANRSKLNHSLSRMGYRLYDSKTINCDIYGLRKQAIKNVAIGLSSPNENKKNKQFSRNSSSTESSKKTLKT